MKKRILSIILAALLVVSLLPTMAFAAGGNEAKINEQEYATLQAAINAVNDGEKIEVIDDITCGTPITINNGKTFTIDFTKSATEQYTFTWDVTSGSEIDQDIFTIGGNSNVTVKNMKFSVGSSEEQGNRIFKVNATGTLTLSNMTSGDENEIRNIPVLNNGGTVTIDGGNITTNNTNTASITPNGLNPIVQNLGGTTTFKGNGNYTTASSTGAAWIGRVITQYSDSTDTDRDNNCGTVIIENGTFNTGHILDVNGKGNITINNATHSSDENTAATMVIFHGGKKSNIVVNNITSSTVMFAAVYDELEENIVFKNGNVKYKPNSFCAGSGASYKPVSIQNGKFGKSTGTDDIHDEIEGFLASGAAISALTSDPDGYTYKVGHCHDNDNTTVFLPWTTAQTAAGDYYLTEDVTLNSTWSVPAGTTNLCLNGHVIKRTGSNSVIKVESGATLNLYDCDTTTEHAGYVDANGLWHLGAIPQSAVNCTAKTIKGGVITGGDVDVQGGSFTMTGGTIAGSTASYGGVYVSIGSFTMTGGTITGNTGSLGGGVYVSNSSFTMTGGTITGNTGSLGGGVCVDSGSVTLGGTAKITDNTAGSTTKTANNLYLPVVGGTQKTVTLGDGSTVKYPDTETPVPAPTNDFSVGVTTNTTPVDGTPVAFATTADGSLIKYFTSDSDSYYVTHSAAGSALQLAVVGSNVVQNLTTGVAYTSLADAITNASSADNANDTLKLLANVETNSTIEVSKTLTLDLNGKVLSGTGNGSVIKITSGATLALKDSNPTAEHKFKDSDTTTGLWVWDDALTGEALKHTVKGGVITGGTNEDFSGGVYVSDGTFTMNGGNIVGNTSGNKGGGVYVYNGNNNKFAMTGGSIVGNTAGSNVGGYGGGVYVGGGTVTMTGGDIVDNTSKYSGGGVYYSGGNVTLGGTAKITGNFKGDTANNLYLNNGEHVTLGTGTGDGGNGVAVPADGMLVGVTTETAPTADTPVKITTNGTDAQKAFFFADDSNTYEIAFVAAATEPPVAAHLALQVKSTPPAPPAPSGGSTPTVTVPVTGDENSIKVSATVSGSTATVKEIKDADLEKVSGGESVEIDLTGLRKDIDTAKIPTSTVEKIGEQAGMSVKLTTATVSFDKAGTQEISEQAKGNTVELIVKDIKEVSLNAVQKEAVEKLDTAVIIDAYLVSGGTKLCTEKSGGFGSGKAKVILPYEIKNNRTAANYSIYYVAEDGTLEKLNAAYDKELAAFIFEIKHFSSYVVAYEDKACSQDETCPIAKFTDANTKAWYHDGVHFCVENGYMQGVSTDKFAPSGTLSRGMIVTMLWRMEGEPAVNYAMSFKDVADDQWYTEAIRWAQSTGVVDGYSADAFGPDDDVTREQLAAILYNYAKLKGQGFTGSWMFLLDFADRTSISSWADEAVHWCSMKGIVNGKTENGSKVFDPQGKATRAEAAAMVQRFCKAFEK